jgi:hypothetical protein
VDTIIGFFFASMPAGIKLLRHQKYAKMIVNPAMCLFTGSRSLKKQRRFVLFVSEK